MHEAMHLPALAEFDLPHLYSHDDKNSFRTAERPVHGYKQHHTTLAATVLYLASIHQMNALYFASNEWRQSLRPSCKRV